MKKVMGGNVDPPVPSKKCAAKCSATSNVECYPANDGSCSATDYVGCKNFTSTGWPAPGSQNCPAA